MIYIYINIFRVIVGFLFRDELLQNIKVVKIADTTGSAVIFKNNKPKYMIINLSDNPVIDLTDNEKLT